MRHRHFTINGKSHRFIKVNGKLIKFETGRADAAMQNAMQTKHRQKTTNIELMSKR